MTLPLSVIAAFATLLAAVAPPDDPVPGALSDVRLARRALEMIHPGYDRYTDRAVLDNAFDSLERDAADGLPARTLFARLSDVAALIRCGHTKLEPSSAWAEHRADHPTYLPLRFTAADGRMIVTASGSPELRPGDEVLSIDARPAGELLARILTMVPSDGWTDSCRRFALGGMSDLDDCEFDHFLPFIHPLADHASLEVRSNDAPRSRLVRVPLMTRAARTAAIGAPPQPRDFDKSITLDIRGDIGVLRIGTFVAYRSPSNPDDVLRPYFERLRDAGAKTLILDLRDNGGGSDSAAIALARYLVAAPFTPTTKSWVRCYRFGDLADRLETWDRSVLNMPESLFQDLGNGYFELQREAQTFDPLTPTFTGRVIALCGPANQSGATLFLAGLRARRAATLVGEPTGGAPDGPTAGIIFFLPLPESGFRLRIPAIRSVTGIACEPGQGLIPDVLVRPTIDDLLAGRDPVLDAAKAIAAQTP